MNTESYLDPPHFRHTARGTLASAGYEATEDSSASPGYKNNSTASLGYPHEAGTFDARSKHLSQQHGQQTPPLQQQHTFSGSSQPLSGFATPQSSPQSQSSGHQRRSHGATAYYSSGSEEDHESLSSRDPPLLGDLSPHHGRRDSGLPIKMTAAKRLPPFNGGANTSIPQELLVEEEEQQGMEGRRNRHDYHEGEIESVPHDDDEQEDVQMLDRDIHPRQVNNLPRAAIHGGSKPR